VLHFRAALHRELGGFRELALKGADDQQSHELSRDVAATAVGSRQSAVDQADAPVAMHIVPIADCRLPIAD
jgi:hypothetical protein